MRIKLPVFWPKQPVKKGSQLYFLESQRKFKQLESQMNITFSVKDLFLGIPGVIKGPIYIVWMARFGLSAAY